MHSSKKNSTAEQKEKSAGDFAALSFALERLAAAGDGFSKTPLLFEIRAPRNSDLYLFQYFGSLLLCSVHQVLRI
jgi:hypothetical protein